MRNNKILISAIVGAFAFTMAGPAWATPKTIDTSVPVSLPVQLVLEALDCSNSSGHYITVAGSQAGTPEVKADVVFKSPSNKREVSSEGTVLFSAGPETKIDKRGMGGGVGGNPWIYIQGSGSSPTLLGRCVQGFKQAWTDNPTVTLPISAVAGNAVCSPKGSDIDIAGVQQGAPTTNVTLWFDNKSPDNVSVPRPHKGSAQFYLTVQSSSGFPKSEPKHGIGGNPDVYLRVGNSDLYFGRCKDLF